MARLTDVIPTLREVGPFAFARRVWKETQADHVFVYASALSYSWLFAFFPLLIFIFSLIPFLPPDSRKAGEELIFTAIRTNLPGEAGERILASPKLQQVLATVQERRGVVVSVSLLVALWAASNGISAVMTALDRCYDIEQGWPFYIGKPLSLMLTVVLTSLVLLVMLLIPIGTFVRNQLARVDFVVPFTDYRVDEWTLIAFDFVRYGVGLTAAFLILSIIYNFCPSVRMRWRLISPGAVFCFVAWLAIAFAFRVYLNATGGTSYSMTFGPAAGLAILLLIFYLYGVVLLIGAEINAEIDFHRLGLPPGTRDLRPAQDEMRRKEKAARRAHRQADPSTGNRSGHNGASENP